MFSQIQFWGKDTVDDPAWDASDRFGRSEGAFIIAVADETDMKLKISVGYPPEEYIEIYGSGILELDEKGIEIANVSESTLTGEEGILGRVYSLPWTGKTIIDVAGKDGEEQDFEGTSYPKGFDVYIYKG